MADDRADAPALRLVGQVQHAEADQDIVGQHPNGVEGLISQEVLAGGMMQVQAAEHIAKTLFLGPFEMVPLEDRLRTVLLLSPAGGLRLAPHQVALVLPPRRGELLYLGAFTGLVLNPGVLLLGLVRWRRGAPLAFGQLRR